MLSTTQRPARHTLLAFLCSVTLFLIFAAPAAADGQSGTDTANVKQATLAETGNAAANARSAALAGAAAALGQVQIHQVNVQVIATPNNSNDTSSQTATNTATANQTTAAQSGDATSSDGSIAQTGNATAHSLTIINQINIQVIAGYTPAGGVHQTASNDATVDQTTVAQSGDATASDGSTARSGDADASSVAVIQQKNFQLYVGKGPSSSDDPVTQDASNTATVDQMTGAFTGAAQASGGSEAISGDAKAKAKAIVDQVNSQIAF